MNELTVIHGNQRAVLQPGQVAYVGRRDSSAVVVDDKRVSREHIRLSWGPRGWVLENVGRSGTFVSGQPVTQYLLGQAVEAHLAVPDGPLVRFEPAPVSLAAPAGAAQPAPAPAQPAPAPAPAPPAAAPAPPGLVAGPAQPPVAGLPGPAARGARQPGEVHGGPVIGALRTLIPFSAWLRDPAMRQWQRLLVVVYALVPLILLIVLQHTANLVTLGWVYCLYVAPLWAIVFWYLIRPGPLTRLHLMIAAVIIVAEPLLIPGLTRPVERALAPAEASHDLLKWITGVGLAEELTKALPVMVLAIVLLKFRKIKLDVRMGCSWQRCPASSSGPTRPRRSMCPRPSPTSPGDPLSASRSSPNGFSWMACSTRCGRA